jgi:hypothetical protein
MKKKSSDLDWPIVIATIGILGLSVILGFCFRAVTMQSRYGVVTGEIPVVQAGVKDAGFHNFEETTYDSLKENTTAVLMTLNSFYFGDLAAFSNAIERNDNKFVVPHVDNTPRTGDLIVDLEKWQDNRSSKANIPRDNILVFIPAGDIPMPIVIQVLDQLKQHGSFSRVILGGGFAL